MKPQRKIKTTANDKKGCTCIFAILLFGATEVEPDKQGCIDIATAFLADANMTKECVITGVAARIRVWKGYFQKDEESFNQIAENMIGFKFNEARRSKFLCSIIQPCY